MNRRGLIVAGVAATAGAAGAWWNAHRSSAPGASAALVDAPPPAASSAAAEAGSAVAGTAPDFWSLRFERADGGDLLLASLRGRPLVVNFWATWCPPCVKELPEIDRFARSFAKNGVQVIGLAVDSAAPVREFLKKTPVSFPVGLAGYGGTTLARQLGNGNGALPFTVVFNAAGVAVQHKLGQTHYDELAGWAAAL
ncbi:MAG: TlpA family protein disulfide reductase [Leptothrix sp. (in: b-proteobacteria)]